ncbi:MAG: cytochrome P450 [Actinomycetes bacterium]
MTSDFLASVTVDDLDNDPYPIYARMRRESPVAYVPCVDSWFVTTHADVSKVAEDTTSFTAENGTSPAEVSFGTPAIIAVDGPVHHDLRRSFDGKFRPREVDGYIENLVRPLAEAAITALRSREEVDLMAEYFEPISVLSLGQVLGLGDIDADTLRRWFKGMNAGATNFERDPAKQAINDEVCAEIDAIVIPRMEKLLSNPDNSTISHMLHSGREPGDPREVEFVLPSLKVAILGGMQEPGHGCGSVVVGLFQADQWQALVADPSLISRAVDEGMRWIAPIGTQFRVARIDVALGGATIPAGAPVSALLSSANRDETIFPNPDEFDLYRDLNRVRGSQAAFGFGKHFCSGHAFARHQMRIALEVLVENYPNLRLDAERPAPFKGWEFRAPTQLWAFPN